MIDVIDTDCRNLNITLTLMVSSIEINLERTQLRKWR